MYDLFVEALAWSIPVGLGAQVMTQQLVRGLRDQVPLGAPTLSVLGWPWYGLWRSWEWWMRYSWQAPDVFGEAMLWLGMGVGVGWIATRMLRYQRTRRQDHGTEDARWSTRREIRRSGLWG